MVPSLKTLCERELAKMSDAEMDLVQQLEPAAHSILEASHDFRRLRSRYLLQRHLPPPIQLPPKHCHTIEPNGTWWPAKPCRLNSSDRYCMHADSWLSSVLLERWVWPVWPQANVPDLMQSILGKRRSGILAAAPVEWMSKQSKLRCIVRGNNRETSWGYLQ